MLNLGSIDNVSVSGMLVGNCYIYVLGGFVVENISIVRGVVSIFNSWVDFVIFG